MGAKNYNKVAQRITTPSEMASHRRILVYARNKIGKTTLCNSAPDVLIIDPEEGTKELRKTNPNVFPVRRWEDMDDIWGYLKLGNHKYKWVAVDGLTKLNNMALRYVGRVEEERNLDRRPGMVDRRDYNKSGELMKAMLGNFAALPVGVIFTAQDRMVNLTVGTEDQDEEGEEALYFVPDLPAGVRGHVNALVDVIGRLYKVRTEIGGEMVTQRRLQIGVHELYDTGFRTEFEGLPDILEDPTIPKLQRLLDTGEVAATKPKKKRKK